MTGNRSTLLRRVASPRLAITLIAALAAFVLVSFLVPQRAVLTAQQYRTWSAENPAIAWLTESLGVDSVFTSWLFIATLTLLAVNLSTCTFHRFARGRTYPPRAPSVDPADARTILVSPELADRHKPNWPVSAGWRLHHADADTWVLWRGRIGRHGSLVLHVGLLLLIVGGIVSAATRFSGSLVLTEGQSVVDAPDAYVEVRQLPRLGGAFTGARIGMESIDFTYEGQEVTDAVARMYYAVPGSDDSTTRLARVNYPLHVAGKSYLLEKAGHAVAVRMTDPEGRERFSTFVNLGETGSDGSSDVVTVDGLKVRLTLISDRAYEGSADPYKYDLNDPLLYVSFEPTGAAASLTPGQSARIGGWTVDFSQARLWNRFMVRADGGRWLSFAAFAAVIVGMAMRWLDPDAFVVVRRRHDGWRVWGRSRHGSLAVDHQIARACAAIPGSVGLEDEV